MRDGEEFRSRGVLLDCLFKPRGLTGSPEFLTKLAVVFALSCFIYWISVEYQGFSKPDAGSFMQGVFGSAVALAGSLVAIRLAGIAVNLQEKSQKLQEDSQKLEAGLQQESQKLQEELQKRREESQRKEDVRAHFEMLQFVSSKVDLAVRPILEMTRALQYIYALSARAYIACNSLVLIVNMLSLLKDIEKLRKEIGELQPEQATNKSKWENQVKTWEEKLETCNEHYAKEFPRGNPSENLVLELKRMRSICQSLHSELQLLAGHFFKKGLVSDPIAGSILRGLTSNEYDFKVGTEPIKQPLRNMMLMGQLIDTYARTLANRLDQGDERFGETMRYVWDMSHNTCNSKKEKFDDIRVDTLVFMGMLVDSYHPDGMVVPSLLVALVKSLPKGADAGTAIAKEIKLLLPESDILPIPTGLLLAIQSIEVDSNVSEEMAKAITAYIEVGPVFGRPVTTDTLSKDTSIQADPPERHDETETSQ